MPRSRLNQTGDTIIEVMLALVVVGLVISLGYGVASRSLRVNRQAQERVEGLKKVESQVERLKSLAANADPNDVNGVFRSGSYCINSVNVVVPISPTPPVSLAADPLNASDYGACVQGIYHISISPDNAGGGSNQFRITARWFGLGQSGKQETTVKYRIYPGE